MIRSSPPVGGEAVAWQWRVNYDKGSPRENEWCSWHDTSEKYYNSICAEIANGRDRVQVRALYAAPPASPLRGRDELHPDTQDLVEKLSWALEDKLLRSQKKYGYTNGWLIDDWEGQCRQNLRQHLEKGDPLDVVAYAAFMWARGWPTASPPEQPAADPVIGQEAKSMLTKIAAECHRAKWKFDLSEDYKPKPYAARDMILNAFNELHRIGDIAIKFREALSTVDYKILLHKYIEHVGQCEGTIFDPSHILGMNQSSVPFTDEELAAFAEVRDTDTPPEWQRR